MGLDACVYCDCFETGKLLHEPPSAEFVCIGQDGGRCYALTDAEASYTEFDKWNKTACIHEDGVLISHRIGNVDLVGVLREEFSRFPSDFPILLSKFVYSSTHCGDFIPVADLSALNLEAMKLSEISSRKDKNQWWIKEFEMQLIELVNAAIQVKKPIAF
jgi:hypothetical protein